MIIEILLLIVLAILLFIAYNIIKPKTQDQAQKLLLDQVENVRRAVEDKHDKLNSQLTKSLDNQLQTVQQQFAQSAKIIAEVTQKLTKLDE
ncbi:MAG: hypothetical protein NTZ80_04090, partial [Patescibacteria group bacterium]|nr:hypothetical protein [Patescibacteria group bacterium]